MAGFEIEENLQLDLCVVCGDRASGMDDRISRKEPGFQIFTPPGRHYGVGEFRNTKVCDLNWLSAFSHNTRLWDTPQRISNL